MIPNMINNNASKFSKLGDFLMFENTPSWRSAVAKKHQLEEYLTYWRQGLTRTWYIFLRGHFSKNYWTDHRSRFRVILLSPAFGSLSPSLVPTSHPDMWLNYGIALNWQKCLGMSTTIPLRVLLLHPALCFWFFSCCPKSSSGLFRQSKWIWINFFTDVSKNWVCPFIKCP